MEWESFKRDGEDIYQYRFPNFFRKLIKFVILTYHLQSATIWRDVIQYIVT